MQCGHKLNLVTVGETGESSDTGDFGHYTQLDAVALNHELVSVENAVIITIDNASGIWYLLEI